VIRRFPWSGANRNSDRIEAGKRLAAALKENLASYPDAAHFVIAHSHGGNLALYALNDPRLQQGLSGIICMNTPFISATRRDAEQLFFGLGVLFIIAYVVRVSVAFATGTPVAILAEAKARRHDRERGFAEHSQPESSVLMDGRRRGVHYI